MALPSSGPISGSQIATELGASSTNISLRGLSSTASFSSPDSYSEFYGYSARTPFYATSTTTKLPGDVCGLYPVWLPYWHDGAGSTPVTGDHVYTNSSGTGYPSWIGWKGFSSSAGAVTYVSERISSGVITSAVICF